MAGKGYAVERVLQIMARRAAMLGLDAPAKTRVEYMTEEAVQRAIAERRAKIHVLEAEREARKGVQNSAEIFLISL